MHAWALIFTSQCHFFCFWIRWSCVYLVPDFLFSPKCRFEFKQSDCPTRYFCFCEKQACSWNLSGKFNIYNDFFPHFIYFHQLRIKGRCNKCASSLGNFLLNRNFLGRFSMKQIIINKSKTYVYPECVLICMTMM